MQLKAKGISKVSLILTRLGFDSRIPDIYGEKRRSNLAWVLMMSGYVREFREMVIFSQERK